MNADTVSLTDAQSVAICDWMTPPPIITSRDVWEVLQAHGVAYWCGRCENPMWSGVACGCGEAE